MVTQGHTGKWLIIKLIITYLLSVIMFLSVAALPEECMCLILPATAFQYHVLMQSVYQIHCTDDDVLEILRQLLSFAGFTVACFTDI